MADLLLLKNNGLAAADLRHLSSGFPGHLDTYPFFFSPQQLSLSRLCLLLCTSTPRLVSPSCGSSAAPSLSSFVFSLQPPSRLSGFSSLVFSPGLFRERICGDRQQRCRHLLPHLSLLFLRSLFFSGSSECDVGTTTHVREVVPFSSNFDSSVCSLRY